MINEENVLRHIGMPERSGRYPFGSGKDPFQRSGDFLSRIDTLKKQGMTDTQIREIIGLTSTEFRVQKSIANAERRTVLVAQAQGLRNKGYSLNQIAAEMGFKNDSSVRSLLDERSKSRMNAAQETAKFLKEQIDSRGMIDVGTGVELELGISRTKLDEALYILERDGYELYGGGVPQVTNPGRQTNVKVIAPPGTEHKEIYNFENVHSLKDYVSQDQGDSFHKAFVPPQSIDSKRVSIRYAEDGGTARDGLIEIRPGVEDLSLGNSRYAQVRILVDDSRYLKGMAVYNPDLPKGVDVLFNTNKGKDVSKTDVMKKIKDDPDNPFGSLIKKGGQSYYIGKDGKEHLSAINKRAEEGDWKQWSDKLSSQFLAKQNDKLIRDQLNLAVESKKNELNAIMALTNPTVKRNLLNSFSEDADSAAVHLYAASLPKQKYHVIMPNPWLKDGECYAPNYENGTQLALVRFPHAGTFEIPVVTVNNRNTQSKKMLGQADDAIGINANNAEKLSGADYDGDTVMSIPITQKVNISSQPSLKQLVGFDPKVEYAEVPGMKYMKDTQKQMGVVSNLITDMHIKGASNDELARAVKHSMTVIDAEKHKLNYKLSEEVNGIASLKKKYQGQTDPITGKYKEGASTLLSKSKGETTVLKRKGSPTIDPVTGRLVYKEVYEEYTDKKTGKTKVKTQASTNMAEAPDARALISEYNSKVEREYANFANSMKDLANQARLNWLNTPKLEYNSTANKQYSNEVDSLKNKLKTAELNAPRERQAQLIANSVVKAKKQSNPDMTKAEVKKEGQRALENARTTVGAKRNQIVITDNEWKAIQSGAIHDATLSRILNHADIDVVREKAMPRQTNKLTTTQVNKLKALSDKGYTNAEIASVLGISATSVQNYTT